MPQPRRSSKVIDPKWLEEPILSLSHLAPPPPLFVSRSVFWMAGCYIGASSGGPQVPRGGRGTGGLDEHGGGLAVEIDGQEGLCRQLPSRNCPRPASRRCPRRGLSILGLASSRQRERRVACEGEKCWLLLLHSPPLHGNSIPLPALLKVPIDPACQIALPENISISISCSSHI